MLSEHACAYRGILRELRKAVIAPRSVNQIVKSNFRSIVHKYQKSGDPTILQDMQNAWLYLRSQREHNLLLERYNPLFDLTAEERIHATARRVGLDLPIVHKSQQIGHNRIFMLALTNTLWKTVQQTVLRLMIPSSTKVLRCDPSAIHFPPAVDLPEITCPDTLNALKTASYHLVELSEPVAFPTETVYGLGAAALNTLAVSRIFSTKGRPADNPLIVHVSSLKMLKNLLPEGYVLPPAYQVLIKHFWPGALTFLFPRNAQKIPTIISAGQATVAIRMPSHPVARALIAFTGIPLAAPSANSSGKPSPTRTEHVLRDLDGKIPVILDGGNCDIGLESTVVDGLHEDGNIRILRPGGITVEDIQRVLKEEMGECGHIPTVLVHRRDYVDEVVEQVPTTPGMKYRHYSPSVPLILLLTSSHPPLNECLVSASSFLASLKGTSPLKIGVLAPSDSALWNFLLPIDGLDWCCYPLGPTTKPAITAQLLFDGLLSLEKRGVHLMLIEGVQEDREGLAVMNRVRKAARDTRWIALE